MGDLDADAYHPGSKEDFDRLYRTAYPRVYRTLAAILADPGAAEDCVQDAFVQAFQAWNRWRPDAPAEAWVHRIAVNRAISYRRSAKLRQVGEVLRRLGRPPHPPDPAEQATRPAAILIAALPVAPGAVRGNVALRAGCPGRQPRRHPGADSVRCYGQRQPRRLDAASGDGDRGEPNAEPPAEPGRAQGGARSGS